MKAAALDGVSRWAPLIYAALVGFYCIAYAPLGLENDDGGFVLGLAHLWREGGALYKDVLYVRPPVSIMLHAIVFSPPLNFAPVLMSRVIFYIEIGLYSGLTALMFARWFSLSRMAAVLMACLGFIVSAHNFPAMAWHTVDGVCFSIASLYVATISRRGSAIGASAAIFFALLAALSKQPFYLSPLLTIAYLVYPVTMPALKAAAVGALVAAVVVALVLFPFVDPGRMLAAISAQTTLQDLMAAGVIDYVKDWLHLSVLVAVLPLAALLLFLCAPVDWRKRMASDGFLQVLALACISALVVSLLLLFTRADRWVAPQSIADALFTVTAGAALVSFALTRSREWLGVLLLHAVAWASSVSWGAMTTLLAAAPSVATIVLLLLPVFAAAPHRRAIGASVAIVILAAFTLSHRYLFSLERPVRIEEASVDMGARRPALRGVRAPRDEADAWDELIELTASLPGAKAVGPNWPLYSVATGEPNRLGMDWLLNAEVGPFEPVLRDRLARLDYFFVYKNAAVGLGPDGKYGSKITAEVQANWTLQNLPTRYFSVYRNARLAQAAEQHDGSATKP